MAGRRRNTIGSTLYIPGDRYRPTFHISKMMMDLQWDNAFHDNLTADQYRNSLKRQADVTKLIRAYVMKWSDVPLESLTHCSVCQMLKNHIKYKTAWSRSARQTAVLDTNRMALRTIEDNIGVLVTWHHMMTTFELSVEVDNPVTVEDKYLNAMDISPLSIIIHCMMGVCINEDGSMKYTRLLNEASVNYMSVNKLLRQSMVACHMYNDRFLNRRQYNTNQYASKNRINDYTDLLVAVKGDTYFLQNPIASYGYQLKKPTALMTKKQQNRLTLGKVKRYRTAMKFGIDDKHDNELTSITHPDTVMRELCKSVCNVYRSEKKHGNSCVSDGMPTCIYSSTGTMNMMADSDSLPDFRCLVEGEWTIARSAEGKTVQKRLEKTKHQVDGRRRRVASAAAAVVPQLFTLRNAENIGSHVSDQDHIMTTLRKQEKSEESSAVISFHGAGKADNYPGVFVIETHYEPRLHADLEGDIANSVGINATQTQVQRAMSKINVGTYVMENAAKIHFGKFRKRLCNVQRKKTADKYGVEGDEEVRSESSYGKRKRCPSSNISGHGTLISKNSTYEIQSTKRKKFSMHSGVSSLFAAFHHSAAVDRCSIPEGHEGSSIITTIDTHNYLKESVLSKSTSSNIGYYNKKSTITPMVSNNVAHVAMCRNLLQKHDAIKRRTKMINCFLLNLVKCTHMMKSSQKFYNSAIAHIDSARQMCVWCTLSMVDGMALVINDIAKMCKSQCQKAGIGVGLSNFNVMTKPTCVASALASSNKNTSIAEGLGSTQPRKTIYTAGLDSVNLSVESLADVYGEWFREKYRTVLHDSFMQVFHGDGCSLPVPNLTGMGKDDCMLISPGDDYKMICSLYNHLSNDKNVRCKTNVRKTLVDCDWYFSIDNDTNPLHGCSVPHALHALEVCSLNNVKINQSEHVTVCKMAREHHFGACIKNATY